MQHPQFKKEINLDAVAAFMQFGNVPTPHCIFNNCYKLKPGHYLISHFCTFKFEIQNIGMYMILIINLN
jgi:asparagine synthase (glutamine-hydrolysing)